MAPFVLKFKGNKSFSPFSNLADSDALTKTWKVCTKVAAHLEQGQRLENLSWRMWHLQNLMVEADNAKSRREFKKMSKNMGERLDKDKGRSIEELGSPDFKVDKLRKNGAGKPGSGGPGGPGAGAGGLMKGMTFTFPADPATNRTPGATVPATAPTTTTKKPLPRPSAAKDDVGGGGFLPMDGVESGTGGGRLAIDTNFTGGPLVGGDAATPTSAFQPASDLPAKVNRTHYRNHADSISSISSDVYNARFAPPPSPPLTGTTTTTTLPQRTNNPYPHINPALSNGGVLHFPNIFDNGFGPVALLCPSPSVKQNQSYGEAIGFAGGLSSSSAHQNDFGVVRPTFEYPLDDLMGGDGASDSQSQSGGWNPDDALTNSVSSLSIPTPVSASVTGFGELRINGNGNADAMQGVQITGQHSQIQVDTDLDGDELQHHHNHHHHHLQQQQQQQKSPALVPSQSAPASPTSFNVDGATPTPTPENPPTTTNTNASATNAFAAPKLPGPPPHHRRRYSTTNAPPPEKKGSGSSGSGGGSSGRHPGSATAPRSIRSSAYGNSAPGGVKSECANCGANSTPLWRRGLNDELNCNACGLFAKLHKRPRPKSLRNSTGEGGSRNPGWATTRTGDDTGEPVSCYNCATIATPLWRKDEDGRTLCNACGLYLKLHGEKRPSSMKSDVIRKRSRHDARRGTSSSVTPSASPGASRRTSSTPPPLPTTNVDAANAATTSPEQQQVQLTSVNAASSSASYSQQEAATGNYQANAGPGAVAADNSPVDLMSMNHTMVTDSGVDPALGPMTFSPGLTYTETLQYPGPLSLSYYFSQYGLNPDGTPNTASAAAATTTNNAQANANASASTATNNTNANNNSGSTGPIHINTAPSTSSGEHQQQQQHHSPPTASDHSPGSASAIDGTPFGPALPPTGAGVNPWDQGFQMPFNPFGPSPYDSSLGVVHPPMLPYWFTTTENAVVVPKTEPDHDITFGHH